MLSLAVAGIRGRMWSFAGSFAALALGVAILSASLLVLAGAQPQVPQRLASADTIVHGPLAGNDFAGEVQPFTASAAAGLTERLSKVDGVKHAVADRVFYAQVPGGTVEGHGFTSLLLGPDSLVDGRAPATQGEIAAPLALGSTVEMLTADGPVQVKVVGVVTGPDLYVSDAWAATLSPGVKAIGLVTNGSAKLSNVDLSGGVVAIGNERAILEPQAVGHTRYLGTQLLVAMAVLATFVTVFVVSSTFALAAAQRRREIGLLRTVGATGRQTRRLILGEALVVGVFAAAAGALLGTAVAPALTKQLFDWGLTPFSRVPLEASPILQAWFVGVAVALLGAWSASRRAAKVGPLEVLRESAVERRTSRLRLATGGLTLAVGCWLAVSTASSSSADRIDMALFAACVFIAAATLLAPIVVGPVIRLVTLPMRGPAAMVVRGEMLTSLRRSSSLVAPVIATVGFAVMLTGMVTTMMTAYPAGFAESLGGKTVVVPDGAPGLSDAAVKSAGPGESRMETRVFFNDRAHDAIGSNIVSEGIAIDGYKVGSSVAVTFADGETVNLKVVGGSVEPVISRELVRAHDKSALTVRVMGGTSAGPGARVLDAKAFAEADAAEETRLIWLFALVLIGLSVGYTGLAVLNTMGMSISARRNDFAVLRVTGATVRQVTRFALVEVAIAVAAGSLLGFAVTVPPLLGMAEGLEEETKVPVSLALHWPTLAGVIVACLGFAAAGTMLNLRARRTTMAA